MKKAELIKGISYGGMGIRAVRDEILTVEDEVADKLSKTGYFKISDIIKQEDKNAYSVESHKDKSKKQPSSVDKKIEKMKTAELEAYANENGIDISGCKNNSDRIDLIKAVICTDRTEKHEDEFSVMNNKSEESEEMLNFDQ
ncbi:MAG: hypothetical protein HFI82_10635 [Eubacterium sp.]|jgi:hypothetical protein|nr:hypothetical protein [Eubacterium sp.]